MEYKKYQVKRGRISKLIITGMEDFNLVLTVNTKIFTIRVNLYTNDIINLNFINLIRF